jgi:cold shock CspA family protein
MALLSTDGQQRGKAHCPRSQYVAIILNAAGEVVLVHYSDVNSARHWKNLKEGEQVEFTQVKTDRGWRAAAVERLLVAAIIVNETPSKIWISPARSTIDIRFVIATINVTLALVVSWPFWRLIFRLCSLQWHSQYLMVVADCCRVSNLSEIFNPKCSECNAHAGKDCRK